MPNSDNAYGVHNKTTREYRIHFAENNAVVSQSFGGNVETAKSFFFTDSALTCWNDNSTQIQWAITSDGNGIKVTNGFGTKGSGTPEADDWAETWPSTKNTLQGASNWFKSTAVAPDDGAQKKLVMTTSSDHLF